MLANDVGCPFPSIHTRNPEEIMLPLKMELKAKKDAVSRRFTLLHWLFAKILMSENLVHKCVICVNFYQLKD